jgi:hypothetical protein
MVAGLPRNRITFTVGLHWVPSRTERPRDGTPACHECKRIASERIVKSFRLGMRG